MVGLACSSTRWSLESMVLSMVMVPFWQAKTTPPRQDGPCSWPAEGAGGSFVAESRVSLQAFLAPVSASTTFEYSCAAAARQAATSLSSAARQRTSTSSSKSMSRPCTINFVMKSRILASSFNCCSRAALVSPAICEITSWRALIFSNRDLLMAVERAIAFWVSICLAFRSYSCRILSFPELTTFNFSTLNSCSALALISSDLSLASFKINWVICKIWFWVSFAASMVSAAAPQHKKR
mmetsp:Transcript_15428/g.38544  ORF Transcript_15428/g.38544 Transcript_15428/m.38544 type:complete len:238 (-) Transcript_15428:88-801(-)